MRTELIRDLLQYLDSDGSLQVGRCSNEANETLEQMPLPLQLKRVLQSSWTNGGGNIGPYTVYSVDECLGNEDLASLIAASMLPIGYAANGDPLVLCFSEEKCGVGLVSHDQFWEERAEPRTAYAEVTGSIDEFLWRAVEDRYLPVDYYAASELVEMRKEINSNGTV